VQLVKQSDQTSALHGLVTVNAQAMMRMVPKTAGDPNRLLRIAFNAVAYDDKLSECLLTRPGQASILGGIMEALKLGITLGGPMQEGWLLPFKSRDGLKAQLIVGYQGYRNIIDRGKGVIDFLPRAVHKLDAEHGRFDYELGSRPFIRHKPLCPQPTTREDLFACYGVANLRGGGQQIDVLLVEEIDAHMNRSRAKDSGPWQTDYVAMGMKTVVRKMAKYLPKSNELLSRALELDSQADAGVDQSFDVDGLVIPEAPVASGTSNALGALKEKLGVKEPDQVLEDVKVGEIFK
jgi:recombination protein RecT